MPQNSFLRRTINVAAAGNTIIVPGVAGYRIFVWQLLLWNVAAQNIQFFDGAAPQRDLSGPLTNFPAQSGFSLPYTSAPHMDLTIGGDLIINLSAGTQVSGWVYYTLERA